MLVTQLRSAYIADLRDFTFVNSTNAIPLCDPAAIVMCDNMRVVASVWCTIMTAEWGPGYRSLSALYDEQGQPEYCTAAVLSATLPQQPTLWHRCSCLYHCHQTASHGFPAAESTCSPSPTFPAGKGKCGPTAGLLGLVCLRLGTLVTVI